MKNHFKYSIVDKKIFDVGNIFQSTTYVYGHLKLYEYILL